MSTSNRSSYTQQRNTIVISFLFALLFALLSVLIAIIDPKGENFYTTVFGFLYQDTTLSKSLLVGIEWLLFMLFFVYFTIALATRKERNGGIPDWFEVLVPAIFTVAFGSFVANLNNLGEQSGFSGTGSVVGETLQGLSNFDGRMKIWIFFLDLAGVILISIYFFFTSQDSEE